MEKEIRSIYGPEILQSSRIRVVILDFDGTIVKSNATWFKVCEEICSAYGITVIKKQHFEGSIIYPSISQYLLEEFKLPASIEILKKEVNDTFKRLSEQNIRPMPGAIDCVRRLSTKYDLAIGSGSDTEQIESILTRLNIRHLFKVIVGNDQVKNRKPAPDTFLIAAERLEAHPHKCLVIEDTPNGIKAAKAADMKCLAVPNRHLKNVNYAQYNPDAIIKSLKKVDIEFIENL